MIHLIYFNLTKHALFCGNLESEQEVVALEQYYVIGYIPMNSD